MMKKELSAGLTVAGIGFLLILLTHRFPAFFLRPYQAFLTLFWGHRFILLPGEGYRQAEGLYILGKTCIGVKLFVCLLVMLAVYKARWEKDFFFLACQIPSAIGLSAFTNLIRIVSSIPFAGSAYFVLIHNLLSLALYFIACFVFYHFLERRRLSHEKKHSLS